MSASFECNTIIKHDISPGYLLHDSGLFSRAYAQWVVEKSDHPEAQTAKKELKSILESADSYEQFQSPEWQKVKDLINMAIKGGNDNE